MILDKIVDYPDNYWGNLNNYTIIYKNTRRLMDG